MPPQRDLLPYSAKDGIVETHFSEPRHFHAFLSRAFDFATRGRREPPLPPDFCLLDTFLSDTIRHDQLLELFEAARPEAPIHLLLADPNSSFAALRASSINQDRWEQATAGLVRLIVAASEFLASPSPNFSDCKHSDLLRWLDSRAHELHLSIKYYSEPPSGTMFFFKDILVCGRFHAGKSSAAFPWHMIVNDPNVSDDLYDRYREEFKHLWTQRRQPPFVFISHAAEDSDQAGVLNHALASRGIEVFTSEQLHGGVDWEGRLRSNIVKCNQMLALVTSDYLKSDWVQYEAGAAWVLKKDVIPIFFDESHGGELPFYVRRTHAFYIERTEELGHIAEAISERPLLRTDAAVAPRAHLASARRLSQSSGLLFEHYPASYLEAVESCREAAQARGVPLSRELKHIVLQCGQRMCMVHLPGSRHLCLRKLSRHLDGVTCSLADLSDISPIVLRGTITPFVEPFWSMIHYVDRRVRDLDWMTTNDGTLYGYCRFSPLLLLKAPRTVVGSFVDAD